MADSDITVSNLAVTVGFGLNHATWTYSDPNANGLPHWKLDAVELWAATNNDRTQAAKVGEGETSAIHFGTNGAAQYYWTRARARNGSVGMAGHLPSARLAGPRPVPLLSRVYGFGDRIVEMVS